MGRDKEAAHKGHPDEQCEQPLPPYIPDPVPYISHNVTSTGTLNGWHPHKGHEKAKEEERYTSQVEDRSRSCQRSTSHRADPIDNNPYSAPVRLHYPIADGEAWGFWSDILAASTDSC